MTLRHVESCTSCDRNSAAWRYREPEKHWGKVVGWVEGSGVRRRRVMKGMRRKREKEDAVKKILKQQRKRKRGRRGELEAVVVRRRAVDVVLRWKPAARATRNGASVPETIAGF